MMFSGRLPRPVLAPLLVTTSLLVSAGAAAPGLAQEASQETPDLDTLETQFEEAFALALEMAEDGEPVFVMQTWGAVFMQAVVLDRVRKLTEGESAPPGDSQAVVERVLERWQQLRPEAGGPDLFRTLRIQDPTQQRAAILSLLDRYPDDPLVVGQVARQLSHAGEVGRATEVAETFLARNPDHPTGYRVLVQAAIGNQTRLAEVLQRWADAWPGDPNLVNSWMTSSLPEQDPEATHRVLSELFAGRPTGGAGLNACLQVIRRGSPSFAERARACVARIAGDSDVPAPVAERATSAMAETAAADGDWSALVSALDSLEPETAQRALIAAARRLETPERCDETIELLSAASEALGDDDSGYGAVASALRGCHERPAAQALYRTLLRQAPTDQAPRIVHAWVTKVNGVYRGELPAEVDGILEQRLQVDPEADGLFEALDVVYRLADPGDRHFDLLRRWHELAPSSFDGEPAVDLAWGLVERGDIGAAVELLERQLESRFDSDLAEMLWQLYVEAASAERAERFAAELIAAGDPWRSSTGHTLAARSAALRQDLATAERHYWQALAGDHPRQEVAVELLYAVGWPGGAAALESMARRVCEETKLAGDPPDVPECAADVLTRAGIGEVAATFLAAQSADLPEDLRSLRKLASTAQSAGQLEVAERARRRILELDPRNEAGWIDFGVLLEKQGRVEELEDLLERSRELFSPPPSFLYRATGRALVAADQPRRALDVLFEARGTLPDTKGGEWSRGWIDHELQQAYRRLGQQAESAVAAPGPVPKQAFATFELPAVPDGTAQELRRAADALHFGQGGRYDPDVAAELYARAAAMGDPLAKFRLALLRVGDRSTSPAGGPDARELFRRSIGAVGGLAAEGEAYAQYLIGTAALIGLGGREDPGTARRWLELAAAQGESPAWHNLAWMMETGRGFETPDPASALDSYRRASVAGNAPSMVAFARLTLTAYGSGALCEEGLGWLERAARAGHASAAAFLGKLLFYGRGECVTRDPQASLAWLEAGAATHQRGATYDLAMALLFAADDQASRVRGVALLEQEASRVDALAVETLAFLHATGIGVPRDPARAGRLVTEAARLGSDGFPRLRREVPRSEVYRRLVEQGIQRLEALAERADPAALAWLVSLYSVGLSDGVDPQLTVALARRAAAAGEATAMRILSRAYKRGDGVELDLAEGLRWQRRCAEAGDSFCMMFQGNDRLTGEQLERDPDVGLSWLRRAAESGNWWAIADLGRLYDQGRYGLARNPDEAAAWKRRLAELGDTEARGWLLYHGYR